MEEEKNNNKASFGMKFLCFLIPLVGLIIFLSNKNEKPEYAKGCGIAALIGFIVGFLLALPVTLIMIVVMSTGAMIVNNVTDTINTASELSRLEIESYNSRYENYSGNITGTNAKALLNSIRSHNAVNDAEKNISVKLDGVKINASDAVSQVKSGKSYNVKFNYNSLGLINEAVVTTNGTSENSNIINNTFTNNTTTNSGLNTNTTNINNTTLNNNTVNR